MIKIFLCSIALIGALHSFAQTRPQDLPIDHLIDIEEKLIKGDKAALEQMASFLDSRRSMIDRLGYHRFENREGYIAMRTINENTLLLDSELRFDSTLTRNSFLQFLHTNAGRLVFDDTTGVFLLTSCSQRNTKYALRTLSQEYMQVLDSIMSRREVPDWVKDDHIDSLVRARSPEALLRIASACYKGRGRFHYDYTFINIEEYLQAVGHLIHAEVAVPNENGKISFEYGIGTDQTARLNFLLYWVHHYSDYHWDDELGYFVNHREKIPQPKPTSELFKKLSSSSDSVAINAFIRLAQSNPDSIASSIEDYNNADRGIGDFNYSLPTFPMRFLRQISILVSYCRENRIDWLPGAALQQRLTRLLPERLPFADRYRFEDSLIAGLSLPEITQLEYFGLLHEKSFSFTHSMGRILDKFYSRNWPALTKNPQFLALYLKKSILFERLGIIGNCGKYLAKFRNSSLATLQQVRLAAENNPDLDIKAASGRVLSMYSHVLVDSLPVQKSWAGTQFTRVANLNEEFLRLRDKQQNQEKFYSSLCELVGSVTYAQLGETIILMKSCPKPQYWSYDFLNEDFGFPVNNDSLAMEVFLRYYSTLPEYQLYEKYLRQENPAYYFSKDSFDYRKVYEFLKYDVTDAFVGGGGGRREDGLYMLIRLLELKFKTRLGFPEKRCCNKCSWGCTLTDRAKYWMHFLEQKGLVHPDKSDPVSFSVIDN